MNTTVYLTLVVAACLCIADGAPEGRLTRKQQRPTRGFKNVEMMTARGFGKRAEHERMKFQPRVPLMVATDFGKRNGNDDLVGEVYGIDNFWENLEAAQEKDGQDTDDKTMQSIPLDWFINEMVNNPDFARSVVRKFIDLNQDGMLSSEELLRNV
ncbi:allatotropins-like isoform X2 [Maniola hyperantus]|uniref:allatotropins-like isoform X2 n=1 Tax=Aphantopus hyperantus TaxID=2795564 RepID=UPI00212E531B